MHHVVAPAASTATFMRTHACARPRRSRAPRSPACSVRSARSPTGVVVHEPSFAHVVPGATVVPHGVEAPAATTRAPHARAALASTRT